MYKIGGNVAIDTIDELLPVFNKNTEVTAKALNILEKKVGKLSRKMKMNNLTDLALWIGLFGVISVTGVMLKQMDIQRQRIDILEGLVSNVSPIGKAILGHKVGDRVQVVPERGDPYFITIRKIENTHDDGSFEIN